MHLPLESLFHFKYRGTNKAERTLVITAKKFFRQTLLKDVFFSNINAIPSKLRNISIDPVSSTRRSAADFLQ